MDRMASLCVYMAIFLLTCSSAVRGIPKTRDQQCKDLGYEGACEFNDNEKPCEILRCAREDVAGYFLLFPQILQHGVPDGTQCGPSKICVKKKCVPAEGQMLHYLGSQKLVYCQRGSSECNQQLLTRNEQCQQYGFDVACQYPTAAAGSRSMCHYLSCGYKGRGGRYFKPMMRDLPILIAPMKGTRCGHDKICLKRMCVSLSEWRKSEPVPNYTAPEIIKECLTLKT